MDVKGQGGSEKEENKRGVGEGFVCPRLCRGWNMWL